MNTTDGWRYIENEPDSINNVNLMVARQKRSPHTLFHLHGDLVRSKYYSDDTVYLV